MSSFSDHLRREKTISLLTYTSSKPPKPWNGGDDDVASHSHPLAKIGGSGAKKVGWMSFFLKS